MINPVLASISIQALADTFGGGGRILAADRGQERRKPSAKIKLRVMGLL
jgi:hypothetical protein